MAFQRFSTSIKYIEVLLVGKDYIIGTLQRAVI